MRFQEDFLILSVAAKPGQLFASYDLLQAIVATGMQFGSKIYFTIINLK